MGIEVTVSGDRDLRSALDRLTGRMKTKMSEAVQAEAEAVADDERSLVPVDTGALQSGIEVRSTGEASAEVGVFDQDLYYAVFIEWGKAGRSGTPFATPASEQSRSRWPSRAADAGREAAEG